jgi:16S rRNA (guanine(966)-N(2))-methyltransferase RsmD
MPDSEVLDLFAGSGNLGLEALSRGAKSAVFNDRSRTCCELIRQNAALLGMTDRAQVLQMDFLHALTYLAQAGRKFDLVFLDPPYAEGPQTAAEKVADMGLLAPQGLIVAEHAWDRPLTGGAELSVASDRKYGDVGVCLMGYGGEK